MFVFHASAGVAVLAAIVAVCARHPQRSLAGFAVALAALIVPLIQLHAAFVAVFVLLAMAVTVILLGGLATLAQRPADATRSPDPAPPPRGSLWVYWILIGLGLLGFSWVVLATGSRQVLQLPPPLVSEAALGESVALVELVSGHVISALIVGLLALCSVIAAVLTLVGERVDPPGSPAPSSPS